MMVLFLHPEHNIHPLPALCKARTGYFLMSGPAEECKKKHTGFYTDVLLRLF